MPEARFDGYATIAYAGQRESPDGFERFQLNEEQREVAVDAARTALTEQGWTVLPPAQVGDADVLVRVGIGARMNETRTVVTADPRLGSAAVIDLDVRDGAMVVACFDAESGALLWTGQLVQERASEGSLATLRRNVTALFRAIPPPGGED